MGWTPSSRLRRAEHPSRRDILRAASALGAVPLLRAAVRPPQSKRGVQTFVYFSDSHVSLKRNVAECLAMTADMRKAMPFEFAINGGDVVDYGWKGEYDSYDSVLADLAVPTYHIPGNHDVRWSPLGLQIFEKRVGKPFVSFDRMGCHFALLDSTVPLSHWGHYETGMLRWLEADLKRVGRDVPVFIATHHWVGRDRVMIDNEHALLRILEPYNVKIILTGHGHNDLLWKWDGHLCTMNKGLYQGSWQRVEVDYDRSEIRLSRRSTGSPEAKLLATVPLSLERSKRPIWALSSSSAAIGDAVRLDAPGAREARWDDGPFRPAFGSVDSAGLEAGTHLLTLREGIDGRHEAFEVKLESAGDRLDVRWTRRLGGGVMSHLKMHEETLFVSAMDGSLYALDPRNGNARWGASTKGYCHSSPAFAEGLAIVGSADGSVHAFRIRDGRREWSFATGGPVYASATIAKGICAIASGDGKVYGLRTSSGQEVWRYALPEGDTAFSQSPAATDGERAFVGAWDKHLYCLDIASGRMLWRQLCTGSTFAFSPAIGGPAVGNGVVYVPANGNELYAFRCESGEPVWKATSPGDKFGYSSPCVSEGSIYIGCLGDLGEARCLDAETGKERWTARTGAVIYDSSPAVGEGLVAIGSVNGALHVLDASSGSSVASYRLPPGHFLSSPLIEGRSIYAATFSDQVVRIDVLR